MTLDELMEQLYRLRGSAPGGKDTPIVVRLTSPGGRYDVVQFCDVVTPPESSIPAIVLGVERPAVETHKSLVSTESIDELHGLVRKLDDARVNVNDAIQSYNQRLQHALEVLLRDLRPFEDLWNDVEANLIAIRDQLEEAKAPLDLITKCATLTGHCRDPRVVAEDDLPSPLDEVESTLINELDDVLDELRGRSDE